MWTAVSRDQNGSFFYGCFLKGREGNTQWSWLNIKSNFALCQHNYSHFITRASIISTNQLFLNSLYNDTPCKAHLEVLVNSIEEYCKVEFLNENKTLLSTLKWKLSSPGIDRQVSHRSNSLCPMRRNAYSIVFPLPYSPYLSPLKSTGNYHHNQFCFLKKVGDK